jgi:hypothetical protein
MDSSFSTVKVKKNSECQLYSMGCKIKIILCSVKLEKLTNTFLCLIYTFPIFKSSQAGGYISLF